MRSTSKISVALAGLSANTGVVRTLLRCVTSGFSCRHPQMVINSPIKMGIVAEEADADRWNHGGCCRQDHKDAAAQYLLEGHLQQMT